MSESEQDRGAAAAGTTVIASSEVHDAGLARPGGGGEPESPAVEHGASASPAGRRPESPAPDGHQPTESRPRRRLSAGTVLLFLLLLGAAVAGAGASAWAFREAGQARKAEREAVDQAKKAKEEATTYRGKFQQSEATWKAAVDELRRVQAKADDVQRARDENLAILDFFNKTLLSAGRPGDGSLPAAFWNGGQGNDVTLRKALDATESQVGGTFADRPLAEAAVREMLGLGYLNVGEAARAIQQEERALALREATQGTMHPDTAACRNQLAVAYRLANRTTEAARLFDRKPNSPTHAAALAASAVILIGEKKPAEAELKLRECLTIRRKIQPDDWTTFETESMLGEALLDQKKYAEAEPRLLSGYEGLKLREATIPPQDKSRITKVVERLVKLYEAWDKKDKAMKWRVLLPATESAPKS
jgi:hypothetical protein